MTHPEVQMTHRDVQEMLESRKMLCSTSSSAQEGADNDIALGWNVGLALYV